MKHVVVTKALLEFSEMLPYASGINLCFIETTIVWNKLETGRQRLCHCQCSLGDEHFVTGVWHLHSTEILRKETNNSIDPDVFYPQLYFVFHLQRKPHYYLLHITLPCIFITLIALLVCITYYICQ